MDRQHRQSRMTASTDDYAIPGDSHIFVLGWLVTVTMQLLFFTIAAYYKFDKVTDFAGSMNFILLALLSFLISKLYTARAIIVTVFVLVSKLYLALYLLYRVMKRGKDGRFDETRDKCCRFFAFWVFQMIWCYGVSLPVMFINTDSAEPKLGGCDIAGIIIFIYGFLCEVISDLQKDAFRSNRANDKEFCNAGLWKYSRHPNFFGEILMWWGIYIIGIPVFRASDCSWGYVTVISPLLTMAILLLLSGIPTAEGDNQKRFLKTPEIRKRFLEYRECTSPLIIMPTTLYKNMPLMIKRVLFFEWKMYECDFSPIATEVLVAENTAGQNVVMNNINV